ncbi:GxxExxY protein [bacterium]|nr:GxxExxY protein [bacterium]
MKVHTVLGPGFPEEYYQKALEYEFEKNKIPFESQKPVQVMYEEIQVGLNYLDFLIDEILILEIKSCNGLNNVHRFQVIKYLASTNYPISLLINFGREKLEQDRILPPLKIQEQKEYNLGGYA